MTDTELEEVKTVLTVFFLTGPGYIGDDDIEMAFRAVKQLVRAVAALKADLLHARRLTNILELHHNRDTFPWKQVERLGPAGDGWQIGGPVPGENNE